MSQQERAPRIRVRALPVLGAALLVAIVALAVSPTLRHQLGISFTRQPQPYVELFFAAEQTARACPVDAGGNLTVEVVVRSHLARDTSLPWTASLSTGGGRAEGSVRTAPGRSSAFPVTLPAGGAGDRTVRIELTGRSEHLVLHCPPVEEAK